MEVHISAKIPSVNPERFDILLTDIDNFLLHSSIAQRLGIQYLANSTNPPQEVPTDTPFHGIMHGCVFFAFPVK